MIFGNWGIFWKVSDFYMEIYGINSNGKVVIYDIKFLGNFDIYYIF